MNICFIGNFTAGGTERATFLVANRLSNKHKVFILNTSTKAPFFKLQQSVTFDYLKIGAIPKRILHLIRYLIDNKIDILISVEAMTGIFSIVATKVTKCRHIVWEHANYYQNQGSRWIQKIRQLELYSADAYVVLTERDKKNFISHFKVKTKLEQIYNITDQQNVHQYDINSKTLISAGHLRKIKNFIIIPEVAKIIFEKYPDWKWKIYGDINGAEYLSIKNRIDELNLQDNVILAGLCSDMEVAYQQAAVYVMTSLQEGLPMVLLEAKTYKLPLISFDIETGPDEIIQDGVNGFLVPPYDERIMADKICELIKNKDLRTQFSDNSKLGLEKFSSDCIVEQWNNLLEIVIKHSSKK